MFIYFPQSWSTLTQRQSIFFFFFSRNRCRKQLTTWAQSSFSPRIPRIPLTSLYKPDKTLRKKEHLTSPSPLHLSRTRNLLPFLFFSFLFLLRQLLSRNSRKRRSKPLLSCLLAIKTLIFSNPSIHSFNGIWLVLHLVLFLFSCNTSSESSLDLLHDKLVHNFIINSFC